MMSQIELRFMERILPSGTKVRVLQYRDADHAPWADVPLYSLAQQRRDQIVEDTEEIPDYG